MRDYPLSATQVKAAAGCSFADAQTAVYLASSSDGRTLDAFAKANALPRRVARDLAYRWGVRFPDYNPFGKHVRLEWRKREGGGWLLLNGETEIGECSRTDEGKYKARLFSQTSVTDWNAQRAMTKLSAELDTMSPDLPDFKGRPIKAVLANEQGLTDRVLFPAETDEVRACWSALDFRAQSKAAA